LDFLRAGAIPALIALAFSLPALGAGCEALDGTYHFVSEPVAGMQPMTFNMLVNLKRGGTELGAFPYDEILPKLKTELEQLIAGRARA